MELEFTADQDDLRDGVRAMLARECPPTLVRAVVEDSFQATNEARAAATGLWDQMVALGWPALTVPEAHGGLGLGAVELSVVLEELGRVVAPGPFVPTTTQLVPAILEAGDDAQQEQFLTAVAAGTCTGALAVAEIGTGLDPAAVCTTATPGDNGTWVLSGAKSAVLGATDVDEIVVVARIPGSVGDEGVGAFVVASSALTIEPVTALDPTRGLGTLRLDDVTVPADRCLGAPGPATAAALRRAIDVAVMGLAIEAVGTCQTIFDVTLDYAKQREQFGVPIGSFQAIKHKMANMLVALERARSTGYFAALTIAEDDAGRSLATSTAKAAANDCQRLLASEGIQIHGGIGYTWEHDMHLYVRRVKTDAALFGTTAEHHARIADLLGV
ncbi:MAG TPA: acyl-CoA dehydrogenase family protein [Acidimicrobiia bacterium]|nr:acyl-CoA dehydrogenase family protein [Acidimicrobiia bacterium]